MPVSGWRALVNRVERGRGTVALLFAGDGRDSGSWSGIPSSLSSALASADVTVRHVDANPPQLFTSVLVNAVALARVARFDLTRPRRALRQARWQARVTPATARARSACATRRLGAVPAVSAVIQMQAGFLTTTSAPTTIYEDLTVVQALRHGYAEFAHMSSREREQLVTMQGRAYRAAAVCCATSRWVRDSIVGDYGVPVERVPVVGIGSNRTSEHVQRDWTSPRFLFVGRDWERKNGDAVLRAFSRLRAVHRTAELHLVGEHPPVREPGVVSHGVLRLGIAAEQERVSELYRRATCFVMPSHVEPTAIAYLEAASFGLPSIGTTVGGSSDLIGDGGLVVPPDDDDALFRAMSKMGEPARAEAVGRQAQLRAPMFTWTAVAARILTALSVPGFAEPPLWSTDGERPSVASPSD